MPLYCLVYTSVAQQGMPDEALEALLKKSRLKNEQLAITGMLLYLDPYFMQILEGTEEIITHSFNVIKQDARHYKVRLIYKQPVKDRIFPNWTMGFHKLGHETLNTVDGFSDFWQRQTSEYFSDSPTETEYMLKKFLDRFKNESLF